MLERFDVTQFCTTSDPGALARELEGVLDARLRGLGDADARREIVNIVLELNMQRHGLIEVPGSNKLSWYGVTSQLEPRSLSLDFVFTEGAEDHGDQENYVTDARFGKQRPCPDCGIPLRPAGAFYVEVLGHGMVGYPQVRINVSGPRPISIEAGIRHRRVCVGSMSRCSACLGVFWCDGELREAIY